MYLASFCSFDDIFLCVSTSIYSSTILYVHFYIDLTKYTRMIMSSSMVYILSNPKETSEVERRMFQHMKAG